MKGIDVLDPKRVERDVQIISKRVEDCIIATLFPFVLSTKSLSTLVLATLVLAALVLAALELAMAIFDITIPAMHSRYDRDTMGTTMRTTMGTV